MKPRQPGSPYETLEALYAEVGTKVRGEADLGVSTAAIDLARRAGGIFYKLDDVAACADLDGFCALVQEAGEAIATTAAARADGVFTPGERTAVRAQLKDLLRAVVAFDQFLAGKDEP